MIEKLFERTIKVKKINKSTHAQIIKKKKQNKTKQKKQKQNKTKTYTFQQIQSYY